MKIQKRYTIEIGRPRKAIIILAGCGGTGSFAALHLARLAYHLREKDIHLKMLFVDPDIVERKNVGRQNFCPAEVGQPKAYQLMTRYNWAFGLDITAQVGKFEPEVARQKGLVVVVGAVDNTAARCDIQAAVAHGRGRVWWLDTGNHEHSGQVLLGNRVDLTAPEISLLKYCSGLPSPGVQHPELLELPAVDVPDTRSCAELIQADAQSLLVNQAAAGWVGMYVSRLLLSHDLDMYATYFDLLTGSARSLGITEAENGT